jgi:hypothetical protein
MSSVSLKDRISTTWNRDGFYGSALRTAVYLLRRLQWRAEAWSQRLDREANCRVVVKENAESLKRNAVLRNRHKNQRCFIIGNGPSLKHQDIKPLADEVTFATNFFYLHPLVGASWQPTYYCLSDPLFFDGREPISTLLKIAERITNSPFLVPHFARQCLGQSNALPPERTYYVAFCEAISANNARKYDLTRPTIGVQTVVQLALLAAIYMGCSPIYLLGLDHDWLAHGGSSLNFYSKEDPKDQPAGNLPGWDYHSMMKAVLMMWEVYELQLLMAKEAGVKIVNCTRGGFLDVFERGNYEQVIADKLETISSR